MISRYEFLYTREKIKKIEKVLTDFEWDSETYKTWEKWIHLNLQEREEIEAKWDKYYEDCRNSVYGKRFFACKDLFKKGNIEGVKKSSYEAKEDKTPFLPKPTSIDPDELKARMSEYFIIKNDLKKLKAVYEEYKGVYEKAENTDSLLT